MWNSDGAETDLYSIELSLRFTTQAFVVDTHWGVQLERTGEARTITLFRSYLSRALPLPRRDRGGQVMAEIVAKYGSKEKELSARLLKKYGRPLPQSVPAEELRQVLARFGMEDEGSAESGSGSGSGASRESAGMCKHRL